MSYDPRYLEGIEHFNVCDFYESHEVWEDLWKDYSGPARIMSASALREG